VKTAHTWVNDSLFRCSVRAAKRYISKGSAAPKNTFFHLFRRLRVRYDKRADIHEARCALIRWQSLRKAWTTD
jgi:hypothetical protein